MDKEKLTAEIEKYGWYHRIEVADGVYTAAYMPHLERVWEFMFDCIKDVDFRDKRVLDIGCRDGMFSFEMERRGAREIIGIDNDLSKGAVELLIPHFKSKVKMHELNVYDLSPDKFGLFDRITFFGVLYHLRFPFYGLKKIVDCLADGGLLILESGMLIDPANEGTELLYCPFEDSPYEPTSCTFFNEKGLSTALRSMNMKMLGCWTCGSDSDDNKQSLIENLRQRSRAFRRKQEVGRNVGRQLLIFEKDPNLVESLDIDQWWKEDDRLDKHWYGTQWDSSKPPPRLQEESQPPPTRPDQRS